MRARCLDLLGESARASANKLKFFRLAFGAAGGFADEVDTREARVAIEGLFGGDGRIQLGWMVDEPTMSKAALKVLLNLVLIAGDALVRGGRLDVGAEKHGGGLDIVVRAEGPRIVLDPELEARPARRARRGRDRPARRRRLAGPLPGRGRRRPGPGRRRGGGHAAHRGEIPPSPPGTWVPTPLINSCAVHPSLRTTRVNAFFTNASP